MRRKRILVAYDGTERSFLGVAACCQSNYDEVYVGRPEGRSIDDLESTVSASLAHLTRANVLTAF